MTGLLWGAATGLEEEYAKEISKNAEQVTSNAVIDLSWKRFLGVFSYLSFIDKMLCVTTYYLRVEPKILTLED